MSEMQRTNEAQSSGSKDGGLRSANDSGGYQLQSDLAKLSLPAEFQDPHQRLAWMTSVCYLVLFVGIGGAKDPADHNPPPPPPPTIVPVELFVPQITPEPPPEPEQAEPEPEPETPPDPTELAEPAPPVVAEPTAVAQLTPAVLFSVPTVGPVKIVSVERADSGPPAKPTPVVTQNANTNRPTGPTVFRRTGNSDGGSYPEPDYPVEAARLKEQGTVMLLVIIDAEGNPVSSKLHQSSGSVNLDRATALFVKKRWKWPPGQPRQYYVPVEYRLR